MNAAAATTENSSFREAAATPVLVDGHVHLYPQVPLETALTAIERNVRREGVAQCVLLLAEPHAVDGFGRLLRLGNDSCEPNLRQAWRVHSKGDNHVDIRHDNGLRAVFLRGQQLVTEEGLEVLATGQRGSVAHGLGLRRTIDEVRLRGGWATIAWGVGKWLGRRGRLVSDAVRDEAGSADVMLGDNGGRPWCWASVPQFDLAVERGMPIVPGSDPLPVRGDESRIASYGVVLELPADEQSSIDTAVRKALVGRAVLVPSGRRVGAGRSLYNQLRMQALGRSVNGLAALRR